MKYPDDYINKIIQGDCLEVMKEMPDKCVDLVLTDPPYGVNKAEWDTNEYWVKLINRFGNIITTKLKNDGIIACFTSTRFLDKTINAFKIPYKWQFIWSCSNNIKVGDMGFAKYTSVLIFTRKKSIHNNAQDLRDYPAGTKDLKLIGKDHPTPKPLPCIKYLINNLSKKSDIILDPFIGSGTTAIACLELNRKYIGIEISPEYYKIARERIKQYEQQLRLF